MLERLKRLLLDFMLITAGITLSAAVFCTLFYRDALFNIELLWQIVLLSFLCTLPSLVFTSKTELTKKQMLVRQIIHLGILLTLLLFFALRWEWIESDKIVHIIVFILLIAIVYTVVTYFTYVKDKMVAKMLNDRLSKYKQNKMDS